MGSSIASTPTNNYSALFFGYNVIAHGTQGGKSSKTKLVVDAFGRVDDVMVGAWGNTVAKGGKKFNYLIGFRIPHKLRIDSHLLSSLKDGYDGIASLFKGHMTEYLVTGCHFIVR